MGRVLLLNATFEPLQVISARRAVLLLLSERADPVVTTPEEVGFRSPSTHVDAVSVLRLRSYVRVPRAAFIPAPSRRAVLARDRGRCAYCGGAADTVDHVVPRSRGGRHEWRNLVASCRRHNQEKGNRLLSELGWKLGFLPAAPMGSLLRGEGSEGRHPSWEAFLPSAQHAA